MQCIAPRCAVVFALMLVAGHDSTVFFLLPFVCVFDKHQPPANFDWPRMRWHTQARTHQNGLVILFNIMKVSTSFVCDNQNNINLKIEKQKSFLVSVFETDKQIGYIGNKNCCEFRTDFNEFDMFVKCETVSKRTLMWLWNEKWKYSHQR